MYLKIQISHLYILSLSELSLKNKSRHKSKSYFYFSFITCHSANQLSRRLKKILKYSLKFLFCKPQPFLNLGKSKLSSVILSSGLTCLIIRLILKKDLLLDLIILTFVCKYQTPQLPQVLSPKYSTCVYATLETNCLACSQLLLIRPVLQNLFSFL